MQREMEKETAEALDDLVAFATGKSDAGVVAYRRGPSGKMVELRHSYAQGVGKRRGSPTGERLVNGREVWTEEE